MKFVAGSHQDPIKMINRPGVAGAVLQSAS